MKHDWSAEDFDEYRKAIVRKSQAKRRRSAISSGMCSMCCTREAREGMKTCAVCSERANRLNKRRIAENKALGLCAGCGQRLPMPGRQRCFQCLQRVARAAYTFRCRKGGQNATEK